MASFGCSFNFSIKTKRRKTEEKLIDEEIHYIAHPSVRRFVLHHNTSPYCGGHFIETRTKQ